MIGKGAPTVILWPFHQAGTHGIEVYVSKTIQQGLAALDDNALETITSKVTLALVTFIEPAGETLFDLLDIAGEVGKPLPPVENLFRGQISNSAPVPIVALYAASHFLVGKIFR